MIDCGDLIAPESGQVTFTPGVMATTETGVGAVATYTCSEGYDLGGNETRSCQANRQWNGAEPICTCKSCNPSHFVDYQLYLQMGFYYLLTVIDCGNLRNPENGLLLQSLLV